MRRAATMARWYLVLTLEDAKVAFLSRTPRHGRSARGMNKSDARSEEGENRRGQLTRARAIGANASDFRRTA
jgi:hypothetical protein